MPTTHQLDIAARFATALDDEDYPAAHALISPECVYTLGDETHRGPDAIVASYRANGDAAAAAFDEIRYGSVVTAGEDGWIVIAFSDHIHHAGKTLHHRCEQWIRIGADDTIAAIEHHHLSGERERLAAFRRDVGL